MAGLLMLRIRAARGHAATGARGEALVGVAAIRDNLRAVAAESAGHVAVPARLGDERGSPLALGRVEGGGDR